MFLEFEFRSFPSDAASTQSLPVRGDGYVYVLFWKHADRQVPFYVGQTNRLAERICDYLAANYAASTDFKVGEAIKYLRRRKLDVTLAYMRSDDCRHEERYWIRSLHLAGFMLLNDFGGYNYKSDQVSSELLALQNYCAILLGDAPLAVPQFPRP